MASHTLSEDDAICPCGCCKPRRRRMPRRRRRRSRSSRRRRSMQQCKPRRRRSRRRRSRRRSSACKPQCCECTKCTCMKCNKSALSPDDCDARSNAFMNFLSAYKRKYGCNRNIADVAAEAGNIWQNMSDDEQEYYNYKSSRMGSLQIKHYDTSNKKGKNVALKYIYNPKKNNLKNGEIIKYSNYLNESIHKISKLLLGSSPFKIGSDEENDDIQITIGVCPDYNDGIVGVTEEYDSVEMERPDNQNETSESIHDESSHEADIVQRA